MRGAAPSVHELAGGGRAAGARWPVMAADADENGGGHDISLEQVFDGSERPAGGLACLGADLMQGQHGRGPLRAAQPRGAARAQAVLGRGAEERGTAGQAGPAVARAGRTQACRGGPSLRPR